MGQSWNIRKKYKLFKENNKDRKITLFLFAFSQADMLNWLLQSLAANYEPAGKTNCSSVTGIYKHITAIFTLAISQALQSIQNILSNFYMYNLETQKYYWGIHANINDNKINKQNF